MTVDHPVTLKLSQIRKMRRVSLEVLANFLSCSGIEVSSEKLSQLEISDYDGCDESLKESVHQAILKLWNQ